MSAEFKMPGLLPASKQKKSLEKPLQSGEEDVDSSSSDSSHESDPSQQLTASSSSSLDVAEIPPSIPENSSSKPLEKRDRDPPKCREQLLKEKMAKYSEILSSLKYHPPEDVGASSADPRYSFEILKNGTIVDRFKFSRLDNKGFYVVGRVPGCDVVAENPTVSRTHAIFQFISCPIVKNKKKGQGQGQDDAGSVGNGEAGIPDRTGLYVFDLNSTHGTYINKNQIIPHRYYRLRVGHVLKFGNSTRLYVLLGPSEDEEEESEKSVTELQNERLQRELERKKLEEQGLLIKTSSGEDGVDEDGCAWGMGEDAEEESEMRENPFAINFEEGESFDNPKKTLRGWFERESEDLVYDCREKAPGQFICRINLPVDGPGGLPVFAEVDIKGKKKEAVHQAALQACQILDKYGVLRVSHHESKSKRKERDWADQDYYSSDEDTFLDRTGSVEKKREKRMKLAGQIEEKVETFDSLSSKASAIQSEIDSIQVQITTAQNVNTGGDDVDIDDYLKFLKTGATDVKKLKSKLREAKEELGKVNKLLNIAKPASLPENLLGNKKPSEVISESEVKQNPPSESQPQLSSTIGSATREGNKMQIKFSLNKPSPMIMSSKLQGSGLKTFTDQEASSSPSSSSESGIPSKLPTGALSLPPTLNKSSGDLKPVPTKVLSKSPSKSKGSPSPKEGAEEIVDNDDLDKAIHQNSASSGDDDIEESVNISQKKKKPRIRQKGKKEKEIDYDYDESDPKYSTWVPPQNQLGDGRTSLNEKLGY